MIWNSFWDDELIEVEDVKHAEDVLAVRARTVRRPSSLKRQRTRLLSSRPDPGVGSAGVLILYAAANCRHSSRLEHQHLQLTRAISTCTSYPFTFANLI